MEYKDIDYSQLPLGLRQEMKDYVEKGMSAGGFLNAVLNNDLNAAIRNADSNNIKELHSIVCWIWEWLPLGSYKHG